MSRPRPRRGNVLRAGKPSARPDVDPRVDAALAELRKIPPSQHALDCECARCRRVLARRARNGALLPAREIREALAAGASDSELAALHRCSLAAISRIATGAVQPDAGGPIRTERPRRGAGVKRSVTLPRELAARIDMALGDREFGPWMVRAAEAALATPVDESST